MTKPLAQVLLAATLVSLVFDVVVQRERTALEVPQLTTRDPSSQRPDAGVHVT